MRGQLRGGGRVPFSGAGLDQDVELGEAPQPLGGARGGADVLGCGLGGAAAQRAQPPGSIGSHGCGRLGVPEGHAGQHTAHHVGCHRTRWWRVGHQHVGQGRA
ncbi:MAG: hypothetical protein ACRD0H_01335, partial [Actinomycetes bacterium]